jgi:hypothetical protein
MSSTRAGSVTCSRAAPAPVPRWLAGVVTLLFSACGGPPTVPLGPADLKVISSTTGVPVPVGYGVHLNGDRASHLDADDSLVFSDLDAGEHVLELTEVPPDCRIIGENPRTLILVAGTAAQTVFQVRCIPPNSGTLFVRAATYGKGASRYHISLDNGLFEETVRNNELLTLFPVPVGTHTVAISGVPAGCQVSGPNPRFIIIRAHGGFAGTVFKMQCPP